MKIPLKKEFYKHSIILLFSISIFAISSIAFTHFKQTDPIIGTWISKNDNQLEWVFTQENSVGYRDNETELSNNKKLEVNYDNELIDTYAYRISTTSPQCGKEVQTGPGIEFLELTDVNSGEQLCYYFNGLTDTTLSISPLGRSTILVFEKQ